MWGRGARAHSGGGGGPSCLGFSSSTLVHAALVSGELQRDYAKTLEVAQTNEGLANHAFDSIQVLKLHLQNHHLAAIEGAQGKFSSEQLAGF